MTAVSYRWICCYLKVEGLERKEFAYGKLVKKGPWVYRWNEAYDDGFKYLEKRRGEVRDVCVCSYCPVDVIFIERHVENNEEQSDQKYDYHTQSLYRWIWLSCPFTPVQPGFVYAVGDHWFTDRCDAEWHAMEYHKKTIKAEREVAANRSQTPVLVLEVATRKQRLEEGRSKLYNDGGSS